MTNIKHTLAKSSELSQFLLFFKTLSVEEKRYIIQFLNDTASSGKQDIKPWERLKGSVLSYSEPFDPVTVF